MRITITLFLVFIISHTSCTEYMEYDQCNPNIKETLQLDSPRTNLTYIYSDTLFEVRDVKEDYPMGLYRFDENKNLRYYAYLMNDSIYRYLEEFDINGKMIRSDGSPVVQYLVWKADNDSIGFEVHLFSLNKKFKDLEFISSELDTIRPVILEKCDVYSNVKMFSFMLLPKDLAKLEFIGTGKIINTCTNKSSLFRDTTYFTKINF